MITIHFSKAIKDAVGLGWCLYVDGRLVGIFFTNGDAEIWKEAVAPTGGV